MLYGTKSILSRPEIFSVFLQKNSPLAPSSVYSAQLSTLFARMLEDCPHFPL